MHSNVANLLDFYSLFIHFIILSLSLEVAHLKFFWNLKKRDSWQTGNIKAEQDSSSDSGKFKYFDF